MNPIITMPPRPDELETIPAPVIADTIEKLLEVLDGRDGDPDVEPNGDELDDPGDLQDAAWIEWNTMRGAAKIGPNLAGEHEDDAAEDDDPGGGNVTDEPHDGEAEDGI